jgi:hypothetical protein
MITPSQSSRWLDAVPARHSRRSYTGEPVPPEQLAPLEALAAAFRPWPDARAMLVREAPASIFLGIIGSYGGISGAPSAIVLVGSHDVAAERIGYTGEALVLEATALGLDTCWVGGFFSPGATKDLVEYAADERVYAVIPIGIAEGHVSRKERLLFGAGHEKRRRPTDEIAPGWESWPVWARRGVVAARVAPSAMNREPWRLALGRDHSVSMSFHGPDMPRLSKRLDCGIAMLHFELGAAAEGVSGVWEQLESPSVGRFVAGE